MKQTPDTGDQFDAALEAEVTRDSDDQPRLTTTHPARECGVCRRCSPPLSLARQRLLRCIAYENSQGRFPNKAFLTRNEAARTRANHYLVLGELEHAGLIVDTCPRGANRYAYEATWFGLYTIDPKKEQYR